MADTTRPRLKDIALRANLSIAAVSLALRNQASLPARTIERVRKIAEELGYTPDPALSALAAYRQRLKVKRDFNVIAVVSYWTNSQDWLERDSAKALMVGARARATALGYSLQHFSARERGMTTKRLKGVLNARGVRGVILVPFENPAEKFEHEWMQFTVVTIERPKNYTQFYHVGPNYFADMVLAWENIRRRGYRRVGLVIDRDLAERVAHQWEAAHAFEQRRTGSPSVPTLVVHSRNRATAIGRWMQKYRPDAVVSRSDGVIAAAKAVKLVAGRDFGYVSLNVVDDTPGVSGIFQHRDVVGAAAVDLLNTLMLRNEYGPNQLSQGMQVDGTWVEGTTLPFVAPGP